MIIFALDTSTENVSVLIAENNKVIAEENFSATFELSAILLDKINYVFSAANIKPDQVEIIAAVCGPGKFTGIRVGLTTLKGLFFEQKVKIVPLISNEVVAYQARTWSGEIVSLINALRNELYLAVYQFQKGQLSTLLAPQIIHPAELPLKLVNYSRLAFIGKGEIALQEIVTNRFSAAKFIDCNPFSGREMLYLAHKKVLQGNYIQDFSDLLPFYLRPPDAEIKPR